MNNRWCWRFPTSKIFIMTRFEY